MTDRDTDPETWLLVSDVDDTLVGEAHALRAFAEAVGRAPRLLVALASSRPIESVRGTLAELPVRLRIDALVGALGTEIVVRGRPLHDWPVRFSGFDRAPIDAALAALGYEPHPPELQTPLKASYAVPESERDRAERAVAATGVRAFCLASGASDFDVIPEGAGKGPAAARVALELGVASDRVVVAGDAANDLSLFETCARGIVVANAREELRRALPSSRAFHAHRPRAWGLLEGLAHYGALIESEGES